MSANIENKKFKNNYNIHSTKDSLLSKNSEWTDFSGIRNYFIFLVIILILQNILESSLNYGIVDTLQYIYISLWNTSIQAKDSFLLLLCSNLTIFSVYFLELFLSKKWIPFKLAILFGGFGYTFNFACFCIIQNKRQFLFCDFFGGLFSY
uniref:Uncharacterized protein n=1 Tax=Meloidogyne enterolobii TaxID=390850 RepID=A0A6V7TYN2_MELEN|nr:unnamed protein product [Meloidogyne enterolobii]